MTYLRKHDCKLPVYEEIWVADAKLDPGFEEYWVCDDCGQVFGRARTTKWREFHTTVELKGLLKIFAQLAMRPTSVRVLHKTNAWVYRDWETVGPEVLLLIMKEELSGNLEAAPMPNA